MSRRALRLGTVAVAVYVAVAVATAQWAPGRLRPLFDGFGSHPGVYNWVKPPKEFAEGNRPPEAAQARIAFGAGGSSPVAAETPDGQAMASLPAGAVPPHPSDSAARVDVRPFDAGTLGPLPAGLRSEGNAYQVAIAYLPSDGKVTTLTAPGTVGVTSEKASDTLLFSPDGKAWRPVEAKPLPSNQGFTASFTEVGYYLPAGPGAPRPVASSGGGTPVALFAVAAAVPLVLGYLLLGRRRRHGTASPTGREPQAGAGRPAPLRPHAKPKSAPKPSPSPKAAATATKPKPAPTAKARTKSKSSKAKSPKKKRR